MDKKFDHKLVENKRNEFWKEKGFFQNLDFTKPSFSVILPPPNVTGKLHLGHALNSYIQDSIIRYKYLNGFNVLWVPGLDHAGIATQAKVEEKLRENNLNRFDLGREKFIEKTWEWKEEYSKNIIAQWEKLGLSLNYDFLRFTLDDQSSSVVDSTFVKMYNDKLIYKAVKGVNWDVKMQTVISNIEVINKKVNSKMFYVKYFSKDNPQDYLLVATTRVETIFSDVAIGINPLNKQLKHWKNKIVINPLNGKELPVILSDKIDLEKGSGAMKISAHALLDLEIIEEQKLEIIESIDKNGLMKENCQEFYKLDRFEAREKIAQKLSAENKIEKVENIISSIGFSERSNSIVEILVFDQWFVKIKPLAQLVLKNLESSEAVNFIPKRFKNILKQWMEQSHDWTISRQLWWGHKIPVWYDKNKNLKAQVESPGKGWIQEEDVLDTWFSSALAPLSFLGFENEKQSQIFNAFYPTSLLVTAYDIIFFWVARMYFQGLYLKKQIPFKQVLIHGLIRDQKGKKMSKSLNNGIDPMDLIEEYGSDSLRFFLITSSSPGFDLRFSYEKLKSSWNLNNKIWNISRYILEKEENNQNNDQKTDLDLWIIHKLNKLKKLIDAKMKNYHFSIIGKEIINFIQEDFSSWYVELSKNNFNKEEAKTILLNFLNLIHPFLPFVSDYIYQQFTNQSVLESKYELDKIKTSQQKIKKIDLMINVIKKIRDLKDSWSISKKETLNYWFVEKDLFTQSEIKMINKNANVNLKENNNLLIIVDDHKIFVDIPKDLIQKKIDNLTKDLEKLAFEIKRSKDILSNENFMKKAPKEKIDLEKEKQKKYQSEYDLIKLEIYKMKK